MSGRNNNNNNNNNRGGNTKSSFKGGKTNNDAAVFGNSKTGDCRTSLCDEEPEPHDHDEGKFWSVEYMLGLNLEEEEEEEEEEELEESSEEEESRTKSQIYTDKKHHYQDDEYDGDHHRHHKGKHHHHHQKDYETYSKMPTSGQMSVGSNSSSQQQQQQQSLSNNTPLEVVPFNTVRYQFNTLVSGQVSKFLVIGQKHFKPESIEASRPHDIEVLQEMAFETIKQETLKRGEKFKRKFISTHVKNADLVGEIELTLTSNYPQKLNVELQTVLRNNGGVGKPHVMFSIEPGVLASQDCVSYGPKTFKIFQKKMTQQHLNFLECYYGQTTSNFIKDYTTRTPNGDYNVDLKSIILGIYNWDSENETKIETSNAVVDGQKASYHVMKEADFNKYAKRAYDCLNNNFCFSDVTGKDFNIRITPDLNTSVHEAISLSIEKLRTDGKLTEKTEQTLKSYLSPSFDNFFCAFPTLNAEALITPSIAPTNTFANLGSLPGNNNGSKNENHASAVRQHQVFESMKFQVSGNILCKYIHSNLKNINPAK